VTALILAAGVSLRLRPLTDAIPKALLTVGGKTLLQHMLEALHANNVERCVIVCGYNRQAIEHFIHTLNPPIQVSFVVNPLYASTNNNYSVWCARTEVLGHPMLLLDSDILFDRRILRRLLLSPHDGALVKRNDAHLGPEEIKIEEDPDGFVRRIGKDIDPRRASGESIGIEKFSPAMVERLFAVLDRRKDRNEFYESSFQELIDQGEKIYAVDSAPFRCIEIDTAEDLAEAAKLAREGF
jgi:choline kinase